MADVRIEHTFNCSADTYWDKIFFDDEYNRRLFMEALSFESFEVVSVEDTSTGKKRVIDASPKMGDLPGPLKKVIGDGIGYRETGEWNKDAGTFTTKVVTNKLSDKIKIEGVLKMEDAGDGKSKRVFTCTVTCKMFGVGGMIEKRVIADMEDSYGKAAVFTNEFIKEKDL